MAGEGHPLSWHWHSEARCSFRWQRHLDVNHSSKRCVWLAGRLLDWAWRKDPKGRLVRRSLQLRRDATAVPSIHCHTNCWPWLALGNATFHMLAAYSRKQQPTRISNKWPFQPPKIYWWKTRRWSLQQWAVYPLWGMGKSQMLMAIAIAWYNW